MLPGHLRAGRAAEDYARRWLERRGLRHVLANYCCRMGELDLVMLDADCLVVVEVRYRAQPGFGGALASVSAQKRQRICRATAHLLRQHPALAAYALRFDVVALTGALPATRVEWCRRAFGADNA